MRGHVEDIKLTLFLSKASYLFLTVKHSPWGQVSVQWLYHLDHKFVETLTMVPGGSSTPGKGFA